MKVQNIPVKEKVSLFSVIEDIADKRNKYPQSMEVLGQEYGYVLYRTKAKKKIVMKKLIELSMGEIVFNSFQWREIATQYQTELARN